MSLCFLDQNDLSKFVNYLVAYYDCYSPKLVKDKFVIQKSTDVNIDDLLGIRTEEPISSIFFSPREDIKLSSGDETKKIILGLKSCDLNALKILDYVFIDDNSKERYSEIRKNTILISSDCMNYHDNCFCTILGNHPYPEDSFDINISQIRDKYVLEINSEQGEDIIKNFSFTRANETNIEERKFNRSEVENNQIRQLKEKYTFNYLSLDYIVKNSNNSVVWDNEAKKCIECGACTFVCPTCHCFLLSNGSTDPNSKIKNWDSCLYYGFTRVAGGANPRKNLKSRLHNRFYKKFVFFTELIDKLGCTGCGRCISACLGDIDIRNVLEEISSEKSVSI